MPGLAVIPIFDVHGGETRVAGPDRLPDGCVDPYSPSWVFADLTIFKLTNQEKSELLEVISGRSTE